MICTQDRNTYSMYALICLVSHHRDLYVASLPNVRPCHLNGCICTSSPVRELPHKCVCAVKRSFVSDLYLLIETVHHQWSSAQIINLHRYFIRSAEPPVSRLGRRGYHFFCLGLQHLFLCNLVLHLKGVVL